MLAHAGVSIRMVKPVLAGLALHGVDPAPLLKSIDLEPALFTDPDARVSHEVVLAMWDAATRATGDDGLGLHIAEGTDVGMLDVQGYILASSPTLRAGMKRVCQVHRLNHDVSQMSLEEDDAGAAWRHSLPNNVALPRQPAEFLMALAVVAARQIIGQPIRPVAVRFMHPKPADVSEHERIFECVVRFGCTHTEVVFHRETLELPCSKADPVLLGVLERHAEALLEQLPVVDSFVARVRSLLSEELRGGNPNAENIAERLHMSVRTLSRRLKELDTSHKQLLDELRRELCDSYLRDRRLGVADVAYLLGFQDASSFHRAFRRWYGETPAGYRKRLP